MEPINEIIKIPPSISPLLVLGEKDCVFNAIRKVTDCKLRYQPEDESFAVYGDPRDVDKLKDIFEEIFSRIFRDENVSKSDIGVICNIVNQRPEDTDETVILSYHGKQVRTKTKGQLEYVRSMRENDITICVAPPGSSKACDVNEEIVSLVDGKPTWKKFGDIKIGDIVFNRYGNPVKVKGVYPQGKKDVYLLTLKDGRKVRCSEDHLWVVSYKSHGSKYTEKVMSTKEIIEKGVKQKRDASRKNSSKFFIPMNNAVEYPEKQYSVDPYVMGAFLGDGCCLEYPLTISCSLKDKETVEKISELIGAFDYHKNSDNNYSWVFRASDKQKEEMKESGLFKNPNAIKNISSKWFFRDYPEVICRATEKHIPECYKLGSINQRLKLLQGLFDTDGSICYSGGRYPVSYVSYSKQLALDVREVLFSLGYDNSIHEGIKKTPKKDGTYSRYYEIEVLCDNDKKQNLFSLSRKKDMAIKASFIKKNRNYERVGINSIEKLNEQVEMVCIKVDSEDRTYLIGKNYIVTHNTFSAVAYGLSLLRNKDVDKIIITRPLVEAGGEEVGIEPGTITEKLYNWMLPCLDVFERVLGKSQLEKYIEDGKIQMLPLGRMRGLSFYHSFCIADEMQNSSITLAKLIATRIGEGSKIVICGDPMQRDFRGESGLDYLARSLDGISGVGVIRMSDADVVRHGLIPKILKAFEDTDKQAEREFKRQMSQGFGIPIPAGVQPVSMHIGGPGSIIA